MPVPSKEWRFTAHGKAWIKEYQERYKLRRRSNPEYVAKERARQKEWRDSNKELLKDRMLKFHFGIGLDEYTSILESQNGCCAICGGASEGKKLAVDHCHKSGKVRGLLCDNCNRALGQFKESPEVLRRAIRYLEEQHVVAVLED